MPHSKGNQRRTSGSVVAAALWRGRWLVLGAVLVAGVLGYAASSQQTPTYTAEGKVLLGQGQSFDPLGGQPYADASRYTANEVQVMGSDEVLSRAARDLGGQVHLWDLQAAVTVKGSNTDNILTVAAIAPTGQAAAARVNAVVNAYRTYVSEQVARKVAAATAATTDPAVVDQIRTQAANYGDGVLMADPAQTPGAPTSPHPLRDGLLLAVVGGLVAMGIALLRRPSAPVGAALPSGARVLGTVAVPDGRGRPADAASFALAMVALDYVRATSDGPVLVTGLSTGSGAAPVAYGLAAAAAQQGRMVLLVDAEPARRDLLARTGVNGPILPADAVSGAADAEELPALVHVPVPGVPDLSVAVLGEDDVRPPNAETLQRVLEDARKSFDLVVVQAAPVHESPLAFALAGRVDAVVAAVGVREDAEPLTTLGERLSTAGRDLAGVVMTRRARGGAGGKVGAQPFPGGRHVASPAELSTTGT